MFKFYLLFCLLIVSNGLFAQEIIKSDTTTLEGSETKLEFEELEETKKLNSTDSLKITCTELLRVAKAMFENESYEAMIDTLEGSPCISEQLQKVNNISDQELAETYRMLTIAYLNTVGESPAAKENMLKFLKVDPGYLVRAREDIDDYDFAFLYSQFRTTPIVYWKISGGLFYSHVDRVDNGVFGVALQKKSGKDIKRNFVVGYGVNAGFEIPLSLKWRIGAGIGYTNLRYKSRNTLNTSGQIPIGAGIKGSQNYNVIYTEVQDRVDFPFSITYQFKQDKFTTDRVFPYVYLGGSSDFLLNARYVPIERQNEARENTRKSERFPIHSYRRTDTSLRELINTSLYVGFGIKIKQNVNFLTFDIRFRKGLTNLVKTKNRYFKQELVFNYGHVDQDFRLDDIHLSVGYIFSQFKPKEKPRKWQQDTRKRNIWVTKVLEAPWDTEAELKSKLEKFKKDKGKKNRTDKETTTPTQGNNNEKK